MVLFGNFMMEMRKPLFHFMKSEWNDKQINKHKLISPDKGYIKVLDRINYIPFYYQTMSTNAISRSTNF
jgi:hypothetical protein